MDSNSGMNLLRAAVARVAGASASGSKVPALPFFGAVTVSGSHRRSVELIAAGEADVAAIDCVTLAHIGRYAAPLVRKVRVLEWTPHSPSLPFITAGSASDATVQVLRTALAEVLGDPSLADVRARLLLTGVDVAPLEDFARVLDLENEAIASGYPSIDGIPA